MGAQFLLLPTKMFLILSCFAATSFASPLQFERGPSLDNRIPLLVQDRVPNPCLTKANDTCIFPFKYNGVEYYRCTYADSPTPWCATMVDLPVVGHAQCQESLRSTRLGSRFKLDDSFLCAGGAVQDTCKGDGGSPLVCANPRQAGTYV